MSKQDRQDKEIAAARKRKQIMRYNKQVFVGFPQPVIPPTK